MENIDKLIVNLLNLSESDVSSIKSVNDNDKTSIYVTLKSNVSSCLVCQGKVHSKGYYSRKVYVSDSAFRNIDVYLKVKRMVCVDCHRSFSDTKYMTPRYHSVSYSVINQVMELLKNPGMTFKQVAKIVGISSSSVVRIFDSHCHIPEKPFPEVLCIDEVYTKDSDYDSKYSCIFYDFEKNQIFDVLPSRKKDYLRYYLQPYRNKDMLSSVKYICIDMYRPYKDIAEIYFKKAIICVDSFHVIKHLYDDLAEIRIRVMKTYSTDSIEYYLLKKFKYLLMSKTVKLDNKPKYNRRLERYVNYRQFLEMILSINEDLRNGYFLKEEYSYFNSCATYETAEEELNILIDKFIKANIKEFEEFINILLNWKKEIINSFIIYKGRRINNSMSEGINSQIQTVLYNSRGIYNSKRRRKRIMYAINKEGFVLR